MATAGVSRGAYPTIMIRLTLYRFGEAQIAAMSGPYTRSKLRSPYNSSVSLICAI
jgi:hypothetical protein